MSCTGSWRRIRTVSKTSDLKRISVIILLFSAWIILADNDLYRSLVSRMSSSCVSFDYTFTVEGKLPIKGSGSALVQDKSFMVEGNGLKVLCDGKTRWTLDGTAKEAVVESVEVGSAEMGADPAILLSSALLYFDEAGSGYTDFNGVRMYYADLLPKKGQGIKAVRLYFHKEKLSGASITVQDGTVTDFVMDNLTFGPLRDASAFRFDEKSLSSDWLVTDFR